MYDITKYVKFALNPSVSHQTVDGFGVNINSKYWNKGKIIPVLEQLVDDLGATLFRLDAFGKSDWIDPDGAFGPACMSEAGYAAAYAQQEFQDAAAMGRWLNSRGIEPYITLSGILPKWMCASDGKTLERFDLFAEMAAHYAKWLRDEGGVRFHLFGPLNETDLGPPEGPAVTPENYVHACECLLKQLDAKGLGDIRLVVAEQAMYNLDFITRFLEKPALAERIAVFGMHCYSDFSARPLVETVITGAGGAYAGTRVWMTEFGDLDQSTEKEWLIAYVSFQRLIRLLEDGMNGALAWDAFDNYHDHDASWTTFGLIKNSWDVYEPKKRFFAYRHIYRFVRPGFRRVGLTSPCDGVKALAFLSPDGGELTITGYNELLEGVFVNVDMEGLPGGFSERRFDAYRTSFADNCVQDNPRRIMQRRLPFSGVEIAVPPRSLFTITTVR